MQLRQVARQHHADLVGEDFLAMIVDDAAAVAVAIEAEADVGAAPAHLVRHGMQHLHVLGVGVVAREGMVELAVERHHVDAHARQQLRGEGPRRAIAAGGDGADFARRLRPVGEVGEIGLAEIFDEAV